MKKYLALIGIVAIGACATTEPIVSNFNGDSVTIVTSQFAQRDEALAAAQAEANRICVKGHKKRAEYASTRTNTQTYENSHLFLCLS